ncbi:MAG: CapA family protein [Ruminococcaceae bacterium]|nr:CapA family protein [Oscillospiraceae bacterium]
MIGYNIMKRVLFSIIAFVLLLSLVGCLSVGNGGMNSPTDTEQTEDTKVNNTDDTTGNGSVDVPVVNNEKKVIKFAAVGDALIHSAIYWEAEEIASGMQNYSGKYYFNDMYEHIADEIKAADIAFVNHEAPIANTAISGYPNFNAPEESGNALVDLGFNVVNIANNHMFDVDHKTTGYADTIAYWATKSVLQIGGYKNNADYDNIRVMNVDGVNIAFLAYTYNPSSTNGTYMNSASQKAGYIAPIANDATITRHIALAKEKADFVVVSMHWGSENVDKPTNEQKRLAKLIADNGADVIIGHHSHTVQPVEWIEGASGNKTLCVYSLGNFISGMLNSKNMLGGMMTFDIVKEDGEIRIENPIFKPIMCQYTIANFSNKDVDGNPVRTEFKVYMLEDYTEDLAKKHGVQNYTKFTYSSLKDRVKSIISSEFLPSYLK